MELTPQNFYDFHFAYNQAVAEGKLIFEYGNETFSTPYSKYVIDIFKNTPIAEVMSEKDMRTTNINKIKEFHMYSINEVEGFFEELSIANVGNTLQIMHWWKHKRNQLLGHV